MSTRTHSISTISPHLAGKLKGLALNDSDWRVIEACFEKSLRHGGFEELDFERAEGQSFNPRPARLGVILIDNANIYDPMALSAGFLLMSSYAPSSSIPEKVMKLLQEARLLPKELIELAEENSAATSSTLASAAFLDRARQVHRTSDTSVQKHVYRMSFQYSALAETCSPAISHLLVSWQEQFSRHVLKGAI